METNHTVILDGRHFKDKASAHTYLKSRLKLNHYYAGNLDSLFEALIMHETPVFIIITNIQILLEALGPYGEKLLETLQVAAAANVQVTIIINETPL